MLGGPAGGVPAVRAYALRSLRTCVPEQVPAAPSQLPDNDILPRASHMILLAYLRMRSRRSVLTAEGMLGIVNQLELED